MTLIFIGRTGSFTIRSYFAIFIKYIINLPILHHGVHFPFIHLNRIKQLLIKLYNTGVDHNHHHQNSHVNYGLYFTFWDKVMGTYEKLPRTRIDSINAKI